MVPNETPNGIEKLSKSDENRDLERGRQNMLNRNTAGMSKTKQFTKARRTARSAYNKTNNLIILYSKREIA